MSWLDWLKPNLGPARPPDGRPGTKPVRKPKRPKPPKE